MAHARTNANCCHNYVGGTTPDSPSAILGIIAEIGAVGNDLEDLARLGGREGSGEGPFTIPPAPMDMLRPAAANMDADACDALSDEWRGGAAESPLPARPAEGARSTAAPRLIFEPEMDKSIHAVRVHKVVILPRSRGGG